MKIHALGELQPHPDVPEWLVSAPIPIPYFDGLPLTFTLDGLEDSDANEARVAIESLLSLGTENRLAASPYVYKCYLHIAEIVDEDDLGCWIGSESEVWEHVHPSEVFVSRRSRRDRAIYVQLTAECDWEPEHGLQLVYRRGSELARERAGRPSDPYRRIRSSRGTGSDRLITRHGGPGPRRPMDGCRQEVSSSKRPSRYEDDSRPGPLCLPSLVSVHDAGASPPARATDACP